jgi:bacterioferritin-associated ferredoxin
MPPRPAHMFGHQWSILVVVGRRLTAWVRHDAMETACEGRRGSEVKGGPQGRRLRREAPLSLEGRPGTLRAATPDARQRSLALRPGAVPWPRRQAVSDDEIRSIVTAGAALQGSQAPRVSNEEIVSADGAGVAVEHIQERYGVTEHEIRRIIATITVTSRSSRRLRGFGCLTIPEWGGRWPSVVAWLQAVGSGICLLR